MGKPQLRVSCTSISLFQKLIDKKATSHESLRRKLYSLTKRRVVFPSSCMISGLKRLSTSNDFPDRCGGMADIYKRDYKGSIVALKILRPFKRSTCDVNRSRKVTNSYLPFAVPHLKMSTKELFWEAIVWRQLEHENVLPFIGLYDDASYTVGLVSPWMENGDLSHFLRNNKTVDKTRIVRGSYSSLKVRNNRLAVAASCFWTVLPPLALAADHSRRSSCCE